MKFDGTPLIPGDPISTQHRQLVMDMKAKRKKEKMRDKPGRIKLWKLKETIGREYTDHPAGKPSASPRFPLGGIQGILLVEISS